MPVGSLQSIREEENEVDVDMIDESQLAFSRPTTEPQAAQSLAVNQKQVKANMLS